MNIYLFLTNKLLKFSLPQDVSGSYSFDEFDDNDYKLINIEARDGEWYLYSTSDVKVINNNNEINEVKIQSNSYYLLRRNEINFLIFVVSKQDMIFKPYSYNYEKPLLIGNSPECNIKFNFKIIEGPLFKIDISRETVTLTKISKVPIYINKLTFKNETVTINYGDIIDVYGLRLTVLPKYLIVNNPNNMVSIDTAVLTPYNLSDGGAESNLEVKDRDLYELSDYFSKAPRLRRSIETKVIKLDKPPEAEASQKQPLLLTLGPMFTMAITSMVTLGSTFERIYVNETTIDQSLPSIITGIAMLVSTFLWPVVTNRFQKHLDKKNKEKLEEKYGEYLKEKETELQDESKLQKEILIENLITIDQCLQIIKNKTINFWDKRLDQSDVMVVRVGVGNELLNVQVDYPEDGFSIEESELKKSADALVEKYKYIENVPMGYSFYKNKVTAIMGNDDKKKSFLDNIVLQLLTFYSYEDLKIVVFTDKSNSYKWEYLKYTNHNFTDNKQIRLFADNTDGHKQIAEYLDFVTGIRMNVENAPTIPPKPYYFIIIDNYNEIRQYDFIKKITETEDNFGFSLVILENRLGNLPSKCNNFINLGEKSSGILRNSFENQEQVTFYDEINPNVNMMEVAKIVANVPILFETADGKLPESITFLEMEKVGKVKQLNILNRWKVNDSTQSLKAEVGVDENGDYMYLDLHEKAHGPHGLIAGMTGSGKSEFIITYILSMAINYSPDDVAFILIDYKGGGLAFAFENKANNILLPHLAGTITNLDKAEMDRTLVSIDSEVKRRQSVFNEAREKLGESTIDIYKYQKFYKEGKLEEPVPHLFIVCDEFAELKSQQPDFMDNLISVARIGRSLGVHLILATQKPSGVVNDQIWSNSKFHVCLKVQDAADSNEMLKKPDAANLKQTGRFYLQVGYDEYFALGQSAWAGAKYFPSDKIMKQIDKSVMLIDSVGIPIKRIQSGSNQKIEAEGEQLAAILKEVIEVSDGINKKAQRLWLTDIPEIILVDDLISYYKVAPNTDDMTAIIGEFDAPEKQSQGLLEYHFLRDGNTCIYGNDGAEAEMILNSIIYSSMALYTPEDINFYVLDFGSQSFRRYEKSNFFGGIVCLGEDDLYKSTFKMLSDELKSRKKALANYGGDFSAYQNQAQEKLPLMVVILNNYDSISENDKDFYEKFTEYIRDSERYGIIYILTANSTSSVPRKVTQCCRNFYGLKVNDSSEYQTMFTSNKKLTPRETFGRGLCQEGDMLHEFQTASITKDKDAFNEFISNKINELNTKYQVKAKPIPCLPEQVTLEYVEKYIKSMKNVPVGIRKNDVEVAKYDFTSSIMTVVGALKLKYLKPFASSLIDIIHQMKNTVLIVIDGSKMLDTKRETIKNYYDSDFEAIQPKINSFIAEQKDRNIAIVIFGFNKYYGSFSAKAPFEELINICKQSNKISIIAFDEISKFKQLNFESWYSSAVNSLDGLYIGTGISDQSIIKVNNFNTELIKEYGANDLFVVIEGNYKIARSIEFEKYVEEEDDE